jgi:ABC-2 type transport system ATP-binding protein
MDEAEYCARVSIMVDGRIAALDAPSAIKRSLGAASMDEAFHAIVRDASRGGD